MDNRRKLLLDFAKQKEFDPLVPENWYNIKMDKLNEIRVCSRREGGGGQG